MCCLNGAAGSVSTKEEKAVKQLLHIGQLRGTDSTGIVSLGRNSAQPCLAKEVGPPELLMETKKFDKVFYGTNKIYLGHNRSRTIGATKRANAHPFCFDHIFGAHNGTVHTGLGDLPDKCDTDSESILSAFNSLGVEETISKINGAWAFTWYDYRDDTINFLRNKERPLYYSFSKDRKTIFWASMVEMLALVLNHNEIEREDNPRAHLVPENWWLKFAIPKTSFEAFKDPVRKLVEGKKSTNFTASHTGVGDDDNPFGTWDRGGHRQAEFGVKGYLPIRHIRHSTALNEKVAKVVAEGPHGTGTTEITSGGNTISETKTNNVVNASERFMTEERKQLFREAAENIRANKGIKGKAEWPMLFLGPYCRIHYSVADGVFAVYRHSKTGWDCDITSKCPDELKGRNITELVNNKKRIDGVKYETYKGLSPNIEPMIPLTESERFRAVGTIITKKKKVGSEKPWVKYIWNPVSKGWTRTEETFPPLELPFTLLDVRSTHCFHHKGKKRKNREIFYKGFNGSLLSKTEFNKIMEDCCIGCGRDPVWLDGVYGGVKVTFLDRTMFICEYCDEEKDQYKLLVQKEKQAKEELGKVATTMH